MEADGNIPKVYHLHRSDDVDKRQAPLDSSGAAFFVNLIFCTFVGDGFIFATYALSKLTCKRI